MQEEPISRKLNLSDFQDSSWAPSIRFRSIASSRKSRRPRPLRNMFSLAPRPQVLVRVLELPTKPIRGQARRYMDWRVFGEQDF
jgi:hypothetical protein